MNMSSWENVRLLNPGMPGPGSLGTEGLGPGKVIDETSQGHYFQ
jgi:hypothetical protein